MSLWVVNQEGDLCQVTKILHPSKTVELKKRSFTSKNIMQNGFELIGCGTYGNEISLGYYKTKKRTFEIFEKIKKFVDLMNHLEIFKNDNGHFRLMTDLLINYDGKTIYEMPKE